MDHVDVSIVVVTRGPRVLTVFNSSWGSFTLPMTKRRNWTDPTVPSSDREESWKEAAARAAAECLGRTVSLDALEFVADIPEYRQGDREGLWKRYHFQLFRLGVPDGTEVKSAATVEWLTVDELLDPNRVPISSTARDLLPKAQEAAAQSGKALP
jgi:hypothetical protein